jgi:hypothetical protein
MRPLRVLGDLRASRASDIRLVQISKRNSMHLKKPGKSAISRGLSQRDNSAITAAITAGEQRDNSGRTATFLQQTAKRASPGGREGRAPLAPERATQNSLARRARDGKRIRIEPSISAIADPKTGE